MTKLKVVELFAGVGAWQRGLQNLNIEHEVVLAVDFDEYAVTAYNALHGTNFPVADITQLDEKTVPDCDVIFYSPPCQSWSAAGKQEGFEDHRGILFFDALRVIKEKKPKYALMENVKNLTQKKFAEEFQGMQDELVEAGYTNYWKILNARDYKIPQNRERVFLISIRNDIAESFNFKFPEPKKGHGNLIDYLEKDAQLPILHNIYGGFQETKARKFDEYSPTIRTASGGGHIPSVIVKGCSLRTRNYMGQPQQLEVRKDDVSNTITTVPKDFMVLVDEGHAHLNAKDYIDYVSELHVGKSGFKVVLKKDGEYVLCKDDEDLDGSEEYSIIRNMSTLEAFRLMGYTDEDYETAKNALNDTFYKGKDRSNTRLYRLAGNSIVVDVVEELLKNLFVKRYNEML